MVINVTQMSSNKSKTIIITMENKEFKPTLDFITEKDCEIKVFCKDSKQVDLLVHTYPYLYPDMFLYEPDEITDYFEQHLFELDDDDDDKIYHNPLDKEGEDSDIEGFYESCFSNGYSLLIGLYVKNGKIKDWYWDKVKQRKRDMSLHTEKYSMRFSQFKSLLFNGLSINDTNNKSIDMDFFKKFDVNDSCYVYCDNLQQVKTLLEEYPKLFPDFFIYTDGHLFHKNVVTYLENLEIGDPNYEYYDVDSFYKSCFTDDYKLAIELKLKANEFVDWTWCKRHIDSMELGDFTFDGFNDFFFKKRK
jgi:hypothetical protein